MEIRYERTIRYAIEVTPKVLLEYAREYFEHQAPIWEEDETPQEERTVTIEDLIEGMAENLQLGSKPGCASEGEVEWGRPEDPHFEGDDIHGSADPFYGERQRGGVIGCTIEELEANLSNLNIFWEED